MPFTRTDAQTIHPPVGWRWVVRPSFDEHYGDPIAGQLGMDRHETMAQVASRLRNLRDWVLAFQAESDPRHVDVSPEVNVNVPNPDAPRQTSSVPTQWTVFLNYACSISWRFDSGCPCGAGAETSISRRKCACNRSLTCAGCGNFGWGNAVTWIEESQTFACTLCVRRCQIRIPSPDPFAQSASRCNRIFVGRGFLYCEEHGNRQSCGQCDQLCEAHTMAHIDDTYYCVNCASRICPECAEYSSSELVNSDVLNARVCNNCHRKYRSESRNETFDPEELPAEKMLLEHNEHRPIRVCSIEMECAPPGGNALAKELHAQGLATWDRVVDYHSSHRHRGFCHVERDRSLGEDGGELIMQLLELDNIEDVRKLHSAMGVVRKQLSAKKLNIDMRCGLHIHIDAHRFGLGHVRNLVILFNYLEDPLYRMAASQYSRHRGMQYASKLHKQGYPDRQTFGLNFFPNNGHNHALNVAHYWRAVRERCGCGANLIGSYENCTCNLGKCTFEFRVWNGTANYRKVAAYAAISQSMVAYARLHDDLDADAFPVLEYDNKASKITEERKEEWLSRLTWMFRNLYFSANERENIFYVIRNCDLSKLSDAQIKALEAVQYVAPIGAPGLERVRVATRSGTGQQASAPAAVNNPFATTYTINLGDIPEPDFVFEDEEF
jgi:hypothetical protein